MKHLSSTLVQWNHPWWSKGKFNQNSFSLSFSKFISIDFQSLNHVISLFFIFVSCLRNLPSGNRKLNYQELMIIKKWKHLYQINTLEDNSWHDNPKNVIIIPWILLFFRRIICCLSETLPSFSILYPSCSWTLSSLFLFGLVLISSLLHSVWNSKYYYPLHNFISSSASVFNSLWLHLINRECLTLLFVVMCPPRFISYHQIQNVAKSRH